MPRLEKVNVEDICLFIIIFFTNTYIAQLFEF